MPTECEGKRKLFEHTYCQHGIALHHDKHLNNRKILFPKHVEAKTHSKLKEYYHSSSQTFELPEFGVVSEKLKSCQAMFIRKKRKHNMSNIPPNIGITLKTASINTVE
jgi:hypothetical protein